MKSVALLIIAIVMSPLFVAAQTPILVRTFNNPTPAIDDNFGSSMAALGNDRVLIGARGAYWDNQSYTEDGAAYLYSTNGALLTMFSNPNSGFSFEFGFEVVGFGNDRVLISANSYGSGNGGAYLFNTNGTLLMSFINPAPGFLDYYGHSIAAVGTDRILVGAPCLETSYPNTGSVFAFDTNGTFLTLITNSTPVTNAFFGHKLSALGNDRVIIGASGDDTGATDAGSAYVYKVDGTLLATLNNPAPESFDRFGHRLAAFGSEGAIIGAMYEDTGASMAGSAYLFSIPTPARPSLTIQQTATNTVVISWPAAATGFVLQQNTNDLSSVNWSNVTVGIQTVGTNKTFVVNPPAGNRFFRLISQ